MATNRGFVPPQWLGDVSLTVDYAFEEIESGLEEGNPDRVLREADEIAGAAETIRQAVRAEAKADWLAHSEGTEALPSAPNDNP